MSHNLFNSLQSFTAGGGQSAQYYSLPQLEKEGVAAIAKLPVSIRIVLESVLRNYDGIKISESDVRTLANWQANETRTAEIPFVVARVVLQDFTGVLFPYFLLQLRSAHALLSPQNNVGAAQGFRAAFYRIVRGSGRRVLRQYALKRALLSRQNSLRAVVWSWCRYF